MWPLPSARVFNIENSKHWEQSHIKLVFFKFYLLWAAFRAALMQKLISKPKSWALLHLCRCRCLLFWCCEAVSTNGKCCVFATVLDLVWSQPIPLLYSGHAWSMAMFFWCGAVKARQRCWRKCQIGPSGLFPGSAPQHHNFIFQRQQQQQNKLSMTCSPRPELTIHTSRCCCFFFYALLL